MTKVKTFSDLIYQLKNLKDDVLNNEVKDIAKKTMQDNIQKYVYDAYTPSFYIRTNQLKEDVEVFVNSDGLFLYNIRTAEEKDKFGKNYLKYIPKVIETGVGYANVDIDKRIGARPFIKKTHEELNNGKFKNTIKESFIKRGYKVI